MYLKNSHPEYPKAQGSYSCPPSEQSKSSLQSLIFLNKVGLKLFNTNLILINKKRGQNQSEEQSIFRNIYLETRLIYALTYVPT